MMRDIHQPLTTNKKSATLYWVALNWRIMTDLVTKAALFAEKAHRGQLRKYTGEPYIVHPAEVAKIVSTLPEATDALICVAWLHDVI